MRSRSLQVPACACHCVIVLLFAVAVSGTGTGTDQSNAPRTPTPSDWDIQHALVLSNAAYSNDVLSELNRASQYQHSFIACQQTDETSCAKGHQQYTMCYAIDPNVPVPPPTLNHPKQPNQTESSPTPVEGPNLVMFISLRGSNSLNDWVIDSQVWCRQVFPPCLYADRCVVRWCVVCLFGCLVQVPRKDGFHPGFHKEAAYLPPALVFEMVGTITKKLRRIVYCGHSKGASVASISGTDFIREYPEWTDRVTIIGFASPHWYFTSGGSRHDPFPSSRAAARVFNFVLKDDPTPGFFLAHAPVSVGTYFECVGADRALVGFDPKQLLSPSSSSFTSNLRAGGDAVCLCDVIYPCSGFVFVDRMMY